MHTVFAFSLSNDNCECKCCPFTTANQTAHQHGTECKKMNSICFAKNYDQVISNSDVAELICELWTISWRAVMSVRNYTIQQSGGGKCVVQFLTHRGT